MLATHDSLLGAMKSALADIVVLETEARTARDQVVEEPIIRLVRTDVPIRM